MALPIILPAGMVGIYGSGYHGTTPAGVTLEPPFKIGTVYNIWDGGATYVYGGDTVIFKEGEQQCRIVTSNNLTYTIIEYARLVTEPVELAP